MSIKIKEKIVSYSVVTEQEEIQEVVEETVELEEMHEKVRRPETLSGRTYKIKSPTSEHSLYVTINDIVLNEGTEYEEKRPFEIFISSKNMEHYQWISALTLIISAIFRKGGDYKFLIDELRSVFDPKGGYLARGGRWVPSLVAEIGDVLEEHLKYLGKVDTGLDEHQLAYLEQKKEELTAKSELNANVCSKCGEASVVIMDGCATCLSCADSKCG